MLVWQSGKTTLNNDDFDVDWSLLLNGDTIASSSWSIVGCDGAQESPLTLVIDNDPAPSYTATLTKVWLSGGAQGFTYILRNTITTASGDTLTEDVELAMLGRSTIGNLTTLTNALQWLGQTSDPQDLVARLIAATSKQVQNFLGYQVLQTSYTRTFNGEGLPRLFVPDVPLVSVTSLTINGQAIPAGASVGGTQQAGYYFDKNSIALIGYYFCKGFQNIQAQYTAGYAAVPADIEQAVLNWMKASWANFAMPGVGPNATSVQAGDFKMSFGGKGDSTDVRLVPMPTSVYAVLSVYQRQIMLAGYV